jgi:integrase
MKWQKTQFPGVRYREHSTRRHSGRPDHYFTIRYKHNGRSTEEALGWSSEGWNAQKASITRNGLVKAFKAGEGPTTLSEKRKIREEKRIEKEKKLKDQITFGHFFEQEYYSQAKKNVGERSYKREEQLFRLWINPTIGDLALGKITVMELNEIKENMAKAGRSPRTIRYALAVIRQVFNYAKFSMTYAGPSPIENVKFPQADNKRRRFLTHEEAKSLLKEIKSRSHQLYEISLISLETGARADEIFSLKWRDVDIHLGQLILWDTKNKNTRTGYMTKAIKELFQRKTRGEKTDFVFVARGGGKIKDTSNAFDKAVNELGLNDGVADRRMKVVFHTLRHTYASWLVQSGENLYTVKELMGHSTLAMTERYSHLSKGTLQDAVKKIDEIDVVPEDDEE